MVERRPWDIREAITLVVMFILTASSLAAYWDDRQYVLENSFIRGMALYKVFSAFGAYDGLGTYAPLHLLSFRGERENDPRMF